MILRGEAVGLIVSAGVGIALVLGLEVSHAWAAGSLVAVGLSTMVWE